MRIIAGRFRGASLPSPVSMSVRPTSDKVRGAIFNILAHSIDDFSLEGARVLDLFAGTGALGFEALSRGASFCLFVDHGTEARGLIRHAIDALGLAREAKLFRRSAEQLGPAGNIEPFDLVFADPPYGKGLAEKALAGAAMGGWFKPGAVVVIEEDAGATFALPGSFEPLDARTYGRTLVTFARYSP